MKTKLIATVTLCITLALSATACAKKPQQQTTMRLGIMNSIDIVPVAVANEKGYFKENGINLELVPFSAAKDRDAAVQAGQLDGVICDEIALSIYRNANIDMKIIGTSTGVWTLAATKSSEIKTPADLKGKKLGISSRTMIEYLAHNLAKENGIGIDELEFVVIPAMPQRLEALRNNQIDAAILPAPFDDAAIADGANEVLKISNKDIMISAFVLSQDYITKNPNVVKSFNTAYDKAVAELNENGIKEFEDLIIKSVGYSEDVRGKIVLPEFQKNYLPDVQKVQNAFDWSKESGIIEKSLTAAEAFAK